MANVKRSESVLGNEGGFRRIAVGNDTYQRLKVLAGSNTLAGYLRLATLETLNRKDTTSLPEMDDEVNLAGLKRVVDSQTKQLNTLTEEIRLTRKEVKHQNGLVISAIQSIVTKVFGGKGVYRKMKKD